MSQTQWNLIQKVNLKECGKHFFFDMGVFGNPDFTKMWIEMPNLHWLMEVPRTTPLDSILLWFFCCCAVSETLQLQSQIYDIFSLGHCNTWCRNTHGEQLEIICMYVYVCIYIYRYTTRDLLVPGF